MTEWAPSPLVRSEGRRPAPLQAHKPFSTSSPGPQNDITSYWKGLSEGATTVQDLAPVSWAPLYGMLKDRFGVVWVLDVTADYHAS
jgi:PhnB protein